MADPNCDKYGVVDFGQGPVTIRCTQVGEHLRHSCYVEWVETDETTVVHESIFPE